MSRMYTVPFAAVAVAAQQDLIAIVAHATRLAILHAVFLSQVSEVGDAAEEGLAILIKSGATVVGSGGAAATPVPVDIIDAVAGFTARVNDTTPAGTGTIVTHHPDNWNIRVPYQLIFTPEMRIIINPARRLVIGLATTPADSITMSGVAYVEEIG